MESHTYDEVYRLEKDNWWYKGKRDLFEELINGRKFSRALDIGCGVGSNIPILNAHAQKVVGIDISQKAVYYCRQKGSCNVKVGDATALPFPNHSFDLIVCSDLLEHVDDEKVFSEIKRVLKEGGVFLFSVPAFPHLWSRYDALACHLRRYRRKPLRELLQKYLTIQYLGYWNFFSYFPCLIFYNLQKLKKQETQINNLSLIPKVFNLLLYLCITLETKLFQKIRFPFGVSLVGICTKKSEH